MCLFCLGVTQQKKKFYDTSNCVKVPKLLSSFFLYNEEGCRTVAKMGAMNDKEKLIAEEKRVADRCAELLKSHPEFPLHEASRAGDSSNVIDHLIDHFNVNSNAKNDDDHTPLHHAALFGHTNTVEHLLNRGAEVDSLNRHGNTPLHHAAYRGHTITVEHLLKKGAEINRETRNGWTPLRYAEYFGHIDATVLLKSKGGTW